MTLFRLLWDWLDIIVRLFKSRCSASDDQQSVGFPDPNYSMPDLHRGRFLRRLTPSAVVGLVVIVECGRLAQL